MNKHLEIKTVEHKGISITVKIDYDKGDVSLVESVVGGYGKKEFVFADRGLEYIQGWLNILDAMKHSVETAKKDLEADLAEKSAFKEGLMIAVVKKMGTSQKKKKP